MLAPPAAAQKVTVGVIASLTGPLAPFGHQLQNGAKLYAQLHKDRLPAGVTVDLVFRDDGSNPALAAEQARGLIEEDKAQILAGMWTTAEVAAVSRVAEGAGIPLIVTGAQGLPSSALPPLAVRFATTFVQEASPLGRWAATADIKSTYALSSDAPAGRIGVEAFNASFRAAGGKISGAVVVPPANVDFISYAQEIQQAGADAAFVSVLRGQASSALRAFRELGVARSKILAMPEMVLDDALPELGPAAEGVISSGSYSIAATRPQNQSFVNTYRQVNQDQPIPNVIAVDAWDGMAAIFGLVEATKGSFTGKQAVEFLRMWVDPTSPRGFVMIDPESRDLITDIYIRRVQLRDGRPANIEFQQVALVKSDGTGGGGDPCPLNECRCKDRSCTTSCPCSK